MFRHPNDEHPKVPCYDGIAACATKHSSGAEWSVDPRVETTYRGVVDVIVAQRPSALEKCVREAALLTGSSVTPSPLDFHAPRSRR